MKKFSRGKLIIFLTNREEISILMLNMNLGTSASSIEILKELETVNKVISGVIADMDDNTVLAVTGSKISNVKYSESEMKEKFQHQEATKIINDDIEGGVKEEEIQNITSGLFIYSKRPSKYYQENMKDKNLKLICPNPEEHNVIKRYNKVEPSGKSAGMLDDKAESEYIDFMNKIHCNVKGFILNIVGKNMNDSNTTSSLNLAPTFASLLDLSIPYSSTGAIIPQTYVFDTPRKCTTFYKTLVKKYYKNLRQILTYRENYYDSHTIEQHIMENSALEDEQRAEDFLETVLSELEDIERKIDEIDELYESVKDVEYNLAIDIAPHDFKNSTYENKSKKRLLKDEQNVDASKKTDDSDQKAENKDEKQMKEEKNNEKEPLKTDDSEQKNKDNKKTNKEDKNINKDRNNENEDNTEEEDQDKQPEKLMILGGMQPWNNKKNFISLKEIESTKGPPTVQNKSDLINFFTQSDKIIKRILDLTTQISDSIKSNQEDMDIF